MMDDRIIDKIFQFGLPTVLLVAFVYIAFKMLNKFIDHNRKDYEGVTKRLNKVEDDQKDALTGVVTKNTEAFTENTKVLEEVKYVISNCKANRGA